MKIRFTQDYEVKGGNPYWHRKDEVFICNSRSANHFLRRGVAVVVDDSEPVKEAPEKKDSGQDRTFSVSQPDPASPEKIAKPAAKSRRGRKPKSSLSTTTTD